MTILSIIAIIIISSYWKQNDTQATCDNMLSQINEMKGSFTQNLLNSGGINELVDKYNTECANHPTNFANSSA
jgi:hypothetical protein